MQGGVILRGVLIAFLPTLSVQGVVTVYNLEPSVGLEELYHSFVTFGDVKDIRDVPGRVNARIIEFYDGVLLHSTPLLGFVASKLYDSSLAQSSSSKLKNLTHWLVANLSTCSS